MSAQESPFVAHMRGKVHEARAGGGSNFGVGDNAMANCNTGKGAKFSTSKFPVAPSDAVSSSMQENEKAQRLLQPQQPPLPQKQHRQHSGNASMSLSFSSSTKNSPSSLPADPASPNKRKALTHRWICLEKENIGTVQTARRLLQEMPTINTSDMQNHLPRATANVREMLSKIVDVARKYAQSAGDSLKASEVTVAKQRKAIEQLNENINELRAGRGGLDKELELARARVKELESQSLEYSKQFEFYSNVESKLEASHLIEAELQSKIAVLQLENGKQSVSILNLEAAHKSALEETAAARAQLANIQKSFEEEKRSFATESDSKGEQAAHLSKKLAEEKEARKIEMVESEEMRASINALNRDSEEKNNKIIQLEGELRDAQAAFKRNKTQLSNTILSRDKYQSQAESLSCECKRLRMAVEGKTKGAASLEEQHTAAVKSLEIQLKERDARVESLNSELRAMLEQRKSAEKDVEQQLARAATWEDKAKAAESRAVKSEVSAKDLSDVVSQLKTELLMVQRIAEEAKSASIEQKKVEEKLRAQVEQETIRANSSSDELGRIQLQFADIAEQCRLAAAARDQGAAELSSACLEKDKLAEKLARAEKASSEREEELANRENELRAAVAKLERAEEAVEGELTCMHCLSVFRQPTTLISTGKTFCAQCVAPALAQEEDEEDDVDVDEDEHRLKEANEGRVQVRRLETLSGKFGFMKQALQQLRSQFQ